MTGRRQAPKRSILSINRIGPWGNIKYEHQLDCGHSELLPRASSAKKIACSSCKRKNDTQPSSENTVLDNRTSEENNLLASYFDPRLDFEDTFSQDELLVRRVAADIASLFNIPVDAVSINTDASSGRTIITSAYVFLSSKDISRLTQTRGVL